MSTECGAGPTNEEGVIGCGKKTRSCGRKLAVNESVCDRIWYRRLRSVGLHSVTSHVKGNEFRPPYKTGPQPSWPLPTAQPVSQSCSAPARPTPPSSPRASSQSPHALPPRRAPLPPNPRSISVSAEEVSLIIPQPGPHLPTNPLPSTSPSSQSATSPSSGHSSRSTSQSPSLCARRASSARRLLLPKLHQGPRGLGSNHSPCFRAYIHLICLALPFH